MQSITISIGGQDRELKFGLMGFFKHVGEVFSGDPLDLVNGSSAPTRQYEIIMAVIYAGLRGAGCKETADKIDQWVQELEFDDAAKIMQVFRKAYESSNGKAGEAEARKLVETEV